MASVFSPPLVIPNGIAGVTIVSSAPLAIPNSNPVNIVLSSPLSVSVPQVTYLYKGLLSAKVDILYGYKTTIDLAMTRSIDSRGYVRWLDMTRQYDNYKTSIKLTTGAPSVVENMLVDDTINNYYLSALYENGFYPFGMGFATGQDYAIRFTQKHRGKDNNIFGKQREYELEYIPAVQDVYTSYTESGAIADCGRVLDHWTLGTVDMPFGRFRDVVNDWKSVTQYNGNSSEVVDVTRLYGDVCKIKVRCSEDQARQILQYITNVMRGTDKTITVPSNYNMFGRRYPDETSITVRLYESKIQIEHIGPASVDISFTLQMVGA